MAPDGTAPTTTAPAPATTARRTPAGGATVPWVAALAVLALTLFAPGVLNDGDTFFHIAAGDWMLAHRAVPFTDPFSATFAGHPWVAHEWLAEIAFALVFRAAGWSGVVALTALAAALAFFLLARDLGRFFPARAVALLVLLAATLVTAGLLARPHILALPVLAAFVGALFRARAADGPWGRAPSWWLLPLMTLWANLHGGFLVGLALTAALGVEATLADRAATASRGALPRWAAFLLAATLAACLNPHGPALLLFPFALAQNPELSGIGEWRPADFTSVGSLEVVLLGGLYVALSRGVRLPPLRLVLLIGLLHAALSHGRHGMLLAFIGPFLLTGAPTTAPPRRTLPALAATLAAAMAALVVARFAWPVVRVDGRSAPLTALARVPPALAAQPVFNDYSFGGYLVFAGLRPFIDARADMYGGPFMARYAAIVAPSAPAMDAAFAQYGVRWTIITPANPLAALLDVRPGWCRLYADATAVVHAPCDARP